jgi:PAS domain S-box-containing protein
MNDTWKSQFQMRALRVVAIYAVFSLLWIYLSDLVLFNVGLSPQLLVEISNAKGFVFILISSLLLYLLIIDYANTLSSAHQLSLESETRFQAIFEGFGDTVLIHDAASGAILDANPAACELLGWGRQELLTRDVGQISAATAQFSRQEALALIRRAAAGEPQRFEWQARHRNGDLIWTEVGLRRITLDGKPRVMAVGRDISARKRAELALQNSREQFASAFQVSPDAININRLSDGMFLQINDGFSALVGYSQADVLGKTSLELNIWCDPRDREALVRELQESGEVRNLEARFKTRDGTIRIGLMSARLLRIDDEPCILSITRDITELRQLEQQNLRSAQLASIGQLAAGVAHEINNPINGVINYAQLLLNRTKTSKSSDEILELIIKEADRVADIVTELLFFSRDSKNEFSDSDLDDLVQAVLTLTGQYITRYGIKVETDIAEDLPLLLVIPQKIEQLLINLMSNARYALDEKYPESHPDKRLSISAHLVRMEETDFCRLVVRDQGVGMSPELLSKINQPFFTTKPSGQGTGLGMSICHEIVTQHQGHISIDSAEGEFTEVTIDLPVQPRSARMPGREPGRREGSQ